MIHEVTYASQEEFKAARPKFINASEMGALMGFSKYESPLSIYMSKIGEKMNNFQGNRLTKSGQREEARIAEDYQYWDHSNPDFEVCLDNVFAGKIMNKIKKCSSSFWNDKWPWLSCSPDYILEANSLGLFGCIEVKNTTSMAANQFVDGLDNCHFLQLQTQLLVTEKEYGEVVQKIDGNDMHVYCFEARKDIQQYIIDYTKAIWLNVQKALAIKKEFGIESYYGLNTDFMNPELQGAVAMLQELEPDFNGSESEIKLLKENIKAKDGGLILPGTDEVYGLLKDVVITGSILESHKKANSIATQKVKAKFGEATVYEWDKKRYASYKPDKNGVRSFRISSELEKELSE